MHCATFHSKNRMLHFEGRARLSETASSLSHLELTDYPRSSLPEGIGNLIRLQHLDLGGSSITELPDSIGSLGSLTRLDFGGYERLTYVDVCLHRCLVPAYMRGRFAIGCALCIDRECARPWLNLVVLFQHEKPGAFGCEQMQISSTR